MNKEQIVRFDDPPAELWLGKEDGAWPIHAFTMESHATIWMTETETARKRRVWKADIRLVAEYRLVPAIGARLEEAFRYDQTQHSAESGGPDDPRL